MNQYIRTDFVKKYIILFVFFFCTLSFSTTVYAKENSKDLNTYSEKYYTDFYDISKMDKLSDELSSINKRYGNEMELSFSDYYNLLVNGKIDQALEYTWNIWSKEVTFEFLENRLLMIKLIVLIIIAAIFNNYSSILKVSFVGEQGFFVTYLIIAVLLIQSFTLVYEIAEETIYYIVDLMVCMLPAFYMSLMLCSGLTTSHMVNSMFFTMLTVVEKVLFVLVLPGIRVYFWLIVLNQLNQKDRFSKLAGLIKQGLQFLLKTIVTGIIGLNVMKCVLIPVYDNAKYNILQKGLSVVPGGSSLSGLSNILVGAGVLIKNSVGITVVILLFIFVSVPLIKMLCFYILYKLILVFVQPISDSRIMAGLQGATDSTGILLRATTTSIVLSVLSIAVVLLTTNVNFYSG